MRLRKISLLVLLAFLIPSCSEKPPVSERDFVEFYVQLQMIDAQYGKERALQKTKVDSLMRAFDVNDSLVNSMLSWYGQKPQRWEKFFADVKQRLGQMRRDYVKPKR